MDLGDDAFKETYRMNKAHFDELFAAVEPLALAKMPRDEKKVQIPLKDFFAATIHWLAHGTTFNEVRSQFGVSSSHAHKVCKVSEKKKHGFVACLLPNNTTHHGLCYVPIWRAIQMTNMMLRCIYRAIQSMPDCRIALPSTPAAWTEEQSMWMMDKARGNGATTFHFLRGTVGAGDGWR